MNEIVTEIILIGDKFMPEMYLKQQVFTYSVCRPFTENKERTQKVMQRGDTTYQTELDKT